MSNCPSNRPSSFGNCADPMRGFFQSGAKLVFGYLTNMVTVFGKTLMSRIKDDTLTVFCTGLLTWSSIPTTHVGFCKAVNAQDVPSDNVAYRSPFSIVGSYVALIFLSILILTKSFDVFLTKFDAKLFVVGYIGLPVYLLCLFGWKFLRHTSRVKARDTELTAGVPEESIQEERARIQAQRQAEITYASGPKGTLRKMYRKGFSWFFEMDVRE